MFIQNYERCNSKELQMRIRILLQKCDEEFIPPSSARSSTHEMNLRDTVSTTIDAYYNNIKEQPCIVAWHEGNVLGFLSYEVGINGSYYITTVVTNKDYRRHGVATALYNKLFVIAGRREVIVRTWSTNTQHMNLLKQLGFIMNVVVKDDRGDGIDTIYYKLRMEN